MFSTGCQGNSYVNHHKYGEGGAGAPFIGVPRVTPCAGFPVVNMCAGFSIVNMCEIRNG